MEAFHLYVFAFSLSLQLGKSYYVASMRPIAPYNYAYAATLELYQGLRDIQFKS